MDVIPLTYSNCLSVNLEWSNNNMYARQLVVWRR